MPPGEEEDGHLREKTAILRVKGGGRWWEGKGREFQEKSAKRRSPDQDGEGDGVAGMQGRKGETERRRRMVQRKRTGRKVEKGKLIKVDFLGRDVEPGKAIAGGKKGV